MIIRCSQPGCARSSTPRTDLTVLAVATTGREAVEAATEHRPDVAVLDLNMPDGDGLWVCGQLRAAGLGDAGAHPHHVRRRRERARRAPRRGVRLHAQGRRAGRDRRGGPRGRSRRGALRRRDRRSDAAALRPGGRGVAVPAAHRAGARGAGVAGRGPDNAAVARRLGVSSKTVRNHVSNIITKLHVSDRSGAISGRATPVWVELAARVEKCITSLVARPVAIYR